MASFKYILYCLVLSIMLIACNKNDAGNQFTNGTYTGKFFYSYTIGSTHTQGEQPADIIFNNGSYTLGSNQPTNCYGTYKVTADTINFIMSNLIPLTLQASLLALQGLYQYHFKGDSLIVTKYTSANLSTSQYRLKRN